jgi:tetratricopeptide (TPR) repeat protein
MEVWSMTLQTRYPVFGMLVAMVLTAGVPAARGLAGQEMSRFDILVPDLRPLEGADRDFGREVAKELREVLNTLLTHRAIERDAVKDALDEVDLKMEDLDCVRTRQLAAMMNAEVALCADYVRGPDGDYVVEAVFWVVQSAESFDVGTTTGSERDEAVVAEHIFRHFDRYTMHLRAAANCEGFAHSRLWADALPNCDEALRLNPAAQGTRYRRARVLLELDRGEEALEELETILEESPLRDDALQLAGYTAATLGLNDDAHSYYSRYLELKPGNVTVRMRVAYELSQAGDPHGAARLVRDGLELAPDDVDLWEQLGGYEFLLGEEVYRARDTGDTGSLAPDAVGHYRGAIEAYERVFSERGPETSARILRSGAVARLRLDEFGDAVVWCETALRSYTADAALWSVYGDALRRMDRLDEALVALDWVEEIDPDRPNVGLRRGSWLLEAGRMDDALTVFADVAAADPDRADAAARMVLVEAHANGVQKERYGYASRALSAVRALPGLTDETRHEISFWLGYAILKGAALEQEPRTLETARSTLPSFQRVLELFGDVGDYPTRVNVDLAELRSNVQTYVEIQEAIIRRGR